MRPSETYKTFSTGKHLSDAFRIKNGLKEGRIGHIGFWSTLCEPIGKNMNTVTQR
jgi:hypothetical protein